jgi:hypothetical protein
MSTCFLTWPLSIWNYMYLPARKKLTTPLLCKHSETENPLRQSQTTGYSPFHCRSRNYATPRLSAVVAFVRPEKEEQRDWLVWPNDCFHWPGVFILQTDAKNIQCFRNHSKLIENRFSRSKVQLTRVWELLTRLWNAWHWGSHSVFTAGGERV